MVIIPKSCAFDFTLFCLRNPKPCPIVEVMDPGNYVSTFAEDSDIRKDVPEYKIFKDGCDCCNLYDNKSIYGMLFLVVICSRSWVLELFIFRTNNS